MSVLSPAVIQVFSAPVEICPNSISIIGSWEHVVSLSLHRLRLDSSYACHLRLDNWKECLDQKTVVFCMDWTIRNEKPVVHIKVIGKGVQQYLEIIENLSERIHVQLNDVYVQAAIRAIYSYYINRRTLGN